MERFYDVNKDSIKTELERAGLSLPPGCLWHAFQIELVTEPSEETEQCLHLLAARYETALFLQVGSRQRLMLAGSPARSSEAARQAAELLAMLEGELLLSACLLYTPGCENVEQLEQELRKLPNASRARLLYYPEKKLFASSGPELGRLLTEMDEEKAREYLRALFGENVPSLSDDMWETLRGFFAGNMNASEASRAMYLHRNTLLYRLDRIVTRYGLDPRQFADACRLQVACLLLRFLCEKENSRS